MQSNASDHDLATFEALPWGMSLQTILFDPNGVAEDYRFDAVNPAFETMTGLSREHVVGRRAREVLPVVSEAFLQRVAHVAKTGEGDSFSFWSVPMNKELEMTVYRPEPGRFVTLFRPTDQGSRGPDAEHSLARYRTFFESATTVNLILDTESHFILDANPRAEAFYGWSREELLRMRIDDINTFPPETLRDEMKVNHEPGTHRRRYRHRTRHQGTRDVEVYISPGHWGTVEANYCIVVDITEELRRQRRELQNERLKAVGELTTSLYHEFGNLLGILFAQVQMLELEISEGPTKTKFQASFDAQFRRARRLVDSVRRFARGSVELEVVALTHLLGDLVELETPACKAGGVALGFHSEGDTRVRMDPALLQQVFLNLVKNALEALRGTKAPRLTIDVRVEEGDVVARVSNNGPSIEPSLRQNLFTSFATSKGEEGTGLGLSFSRNIVTSHGGSIVLTEDEDTTFEVRLPAVSN